MPIKATKGRSEWPFGHLTRFLNAALVSVTPLKYMQQGECIALHSTSVRVRCLHLAPPFCTDNVRRGLVGYRVWGRERRTKKSLFSSIKRLVFVFKQISMKKFKQMQNQQGAKVAAVDKV